MRIWVQPLASLSGLSFWCCCELWYRLLWLWCRLAATALIRPLAWDLPYAVGVALKSQKKEKRKKKRKEKENTDGEQTSKKFKGK